MKKYLIKIVGVICTACLIASAFGLCVSATDGEAIKFEYKKGTNNASSAYKSSIYYQRLTMLEQSGDNVADLLTVALSQLGYSEGNSEADFGGEAQGNANFTEYNYNMGSFGIGYGDDGNGGTYDWCASFVSFCLLQSGATNHNSISDWCRNHVADENSPKYDPDYSKYVWREVSCQKWVDNLKSAELYNLSAFNGGEYLPKSGDLIFFRWAANKNVGHIGIVVYADAERVYTVEGNTSGGSTMVSNGGGVYFKSYPLDYECIAGYGTLPHESASDQPLIDYSGNTPTAGVYVTTADTYLYEDKSFEGDYSVIPAYTLIRVPAVVEDGLDGLLAVEYSVGGDTFKGYAINSSTARLIQLTVGLPEILPESFLSIDKTKGFISGTINGYTLNGESFDISDGITVEGIGRIVLSAELLFEDKVERGGYFIDGDREDIKWIDGSVSYDKDAAKCEIWADIYGLSEGEHTLTFVAELGNGAIPIIDTCKFTFYNEKQPVEEDISGETPIEQEQQTEEATEVQTESTGIETVGCGAFVQIHILAAVLLLVCGYAVKKNKKTEC